MKAYAHEAMNKGPWGGANGRIFWKEYFELGYVPYPESMGSTAQTLEYAYDDFCGYQLAKHSGSDEAFVAKIDSVFTQPDTVIPGTYGGMIHEMVEMQLAGMGQYAHGNQPIQHLPYLYSYAGQPWKTQYHVRNIMSRLYNSSEEGFPGDEDQGGMSSWYILSALGLYSVCPGTDQYVIGSPIFNKHTIRLENGNEFVIIAENNSAENIYIQSATLNGRELVNNYITYNDIIDGGTLHLVMGNTPNMNRGTEIIRHLSPFLNRNRSFFLNFAPCC